MAQKKDWTVLWWIVWITATILSFFISFYFWTPFIAKHVGPMSQGNAQILWVTAVFGSWMVLLVPLIVMMYNKVDKAYEDSRNQREAAAYEKAKKEFKLRNVSIPEEKRRLPEPIRKTLKTIKPAIKRGHLLTVELKDGRRFDHVFVVDREFVLGIYDRTELPFEVSDIVNIVPADLDKLPAFLTEKWLRLDGVGQAL